MLVGKFFRAGSAEASLAVTACTAEAADSKEKKGHKTAAIGAGPPVSVMGGCRAGRCGTYTGHGGCNDGRRGYEDGAGMDHALAPDRPVEAGYRHFNLADGISGGRTITVSAVEDRVQRVRSLDPFTVILVRERASTAPHAAIQALGGCFPPSWMAGPFPRPAGAEPYFNYGA